MQGEASVPTCGMPNGSGPTADGRGRFPCCSSGMAASIFGAGGRAIRASHSCAGPSWPHDSGGTPAQTNHMRLRYLHTCSAQGDNSNGHAIPTTPSTRF